MFRRTDLSHFAPQVRRRCPLKAERNSRFDWGMSVLSKDDLFNDGTYPGVEKEALIVGRGTRGEIVNVGTHSESNVTVYLVEFEGGQVVGCFEDEIQPLI
jgi:nitrogen fixation protein NifZ